jgi:hypothetical protein
MKVSKTYALITEESAENGDIEDSGFEYQDYEDNIVEAVARIEKELGYFDGLESFPTIYGCDGSVDYSDGSVTTYALHFDGSAEELTELKALLASHRFNSCK